MPLHAGWLRNRSSTNLLASSRQLDAARMKDPAVLRQRAQVKLVLDDELERLVPKRVAVVELTMTDGRLLSGCKLCAERRRVQ